MHYCRQRYLAFPAVHLALLALYFILSSNVFISCNLITHDAHGHEVYMGRMNIVSIVDDSTASACLAKVHSIIESSTPSSRKRLFFRFLMLGEVTKKRYEEWAKAMSCFNVDFETKLWRGMPSTELSKSLSGKQFNTEYIMSRIYLIDYFPDMHENEHSKYLYLDNDAFVTCDLTELFSAPLITQASILAVNAHHQQAIKQTHTHSDVHTTNQLQNKVRAAHAAHVQAAVTSISYEMAPMGLVLEEHHLNAGYITANFNHSHPLVKSIIHGQKKDLFINGGVAMVHIPTWKKQKVTQKAEALLLENARQDNGMVWTDSAGDQGLFYVLFQGTRIASLEAKYNMRRLPKKTVNMLNDGVLGIIHLAGSTSGHIETICREPLRYPLFLPNVITLFLSVIHNYMQKCNAYIKHEGINYSTPYSFSPDCNTAVDVVTQYMASAEDEGGIAKYNPGLGPFGWPIKGFVHRAVPVRVT